MKWLRVFIVSLIIGLAATSIIVAASDITMAQYRGTILIVNSDSAATNVSVPVSGLNTGALVSEGYVWSNYTNTNVAMAAGTDIAYMPNAAANSTILFLPSVTQLTSTEAYLYTGGTQTMNSTLAYFPDTAGMTVADNASLEPGSNFQFDIKGYPVTSTASNILLKTGAFTIANAGGNITATVGNNTGLTSQLTPNGAGAYTDIPTLTGAATHWQATLTNDGDTSYVGHSIDGIVTKDTFTMSDGTVPANAVIDSVSFSAVVRNNGGDADEVRTQARLGGVNVQSGIHTTPLDSTYYTYSDNLARPGGGSWAPADVPNIEAGVSVGDVGMPTTSYVTQTYATVNYHMPYAVVSSVVSTGVHDVRVSADGTNLRLYVDDMVTAKSTQALNGAAVLNNANNWIYAASGSMLYVEYIKEYVGGVLKGSWVWQPAATFTDLSGNGNTATPTFRTTSSNANVTATLTGFEPISQAVATSSALYSAPDLLHPYNMTGNFTVPINATFPGADILVALSGISSTPSQLPLLIISAFLTIVIGLSLSAMLKKYNSVSMAIKISATSLCMMVGIWTKVDDYWMLIVYWILAAALALLARR